MSIHHNPIQKGRAKRPTTKSAMSLYARTAHKKASRALGYALTLDTFAGWQSASVIWQARLTPEEIAAVAWASLKGMEPEFAEMAVTAALGGAGVPFFASDDAMSDAGLWADIASPAERAACAVACFNRFSHLEREDFRAFVEAR